MQILIYLVPKFPTMLNDSLNNLDCDRNSELLCRFRSIALDFSYSLLYSLYTI